VAESQSYRNLVTARDLVAFRVQVEETDLYIRAGRDLGEEAKEALVKVRSDLESYISRNPEFKSSLEPLTVSGDAPAIVREMSGAAAKAGVGPMAAVAGAIGEWVGRELLRFSPEVIVENGGDIFLNVGRRRCVMIYAGRSPLSGRVGIEIGPEGTPGGVCTSSGTVGHSLSLGAADAVTVLSRWTALADAAATAVGNVVRSEGDIEKGLELAEGIDGVEGVVIIIGEKMGVWGEVVLSKPLLRKGVDMGAGDVVGKAIDRRYRRRE
jgi:ApbE superfamily uncharacterized protein (UPF0280 family)